MKNMSMREQIWRASEAFDLVVADTPALRCEAYRLRYQVYSLERGFEPGDNGMEIDSYDDQSQHVLLLHRESDAVVGTVRLIPSAGKSSIELPMTNVCRPSLLSHLPPHS